MGDAEERLSVGDSRFLLDAVSLLSGCGEAKRFNPAALVYQVPPHLDTINVSQGCVITYKVLF